MNNPEFEANILKSIDESGYSEKQTDLQVDKKGTARQQVKQANKPQQHVTFQKKQKKSTVIFKAK